jgi:hypothetical protein
MTNTLKLSLFSAAFLGLSATSGFAQSTGHLSVKVPFEFTAGSVTLPAGEYNFQGDHTGVVTISSLDSRKSVMVLTNPQGGYSANEQTAVKFDKVNGAYELTEVDMQGEPGRRLVKLEGSTDRPANLSARAAAGSASKTLKK